MCKRTCSMGKDKALVSQLQVLGTEKQHFPRLTTALRGTATSVDLSGRSWKLQSIAWPQYRQALSGKMIRAQLQLGHAIHVLGTGLNLLPRGPAEPDDGMPSAHAGPLGHRLRSLLLTLVAAIIFGGPLLRLLHQANLQQVVYNLAYRGGRICHPFLLEEILQ